MACIRLYTDEISRPTGTVLVLRGDLKPGQHLICGKASAKIRILTDSNGKSVKAAYPGMAVIVSGWKELPNAGDEVLSGTEAELCSRRWFLVNVSLSYSSDPPGCSDMSVLDVIIIVGRAYNVTVDRCIMTANMEICPDTVRAHLTFTRSLLS